MTPDLQARLDTAQRELALANSDLIALHSELDGKIADLHRNAALLREYAARIEASNAELDRFAACASHDLKEPLRKIRNFSAHLLEHLEPVLDQESREDFQRIQRAADRMGAFIDDLLVYSRLSAAGPVSVPVDLNELVHSLVEELKPTLDALHGKVEIEPLPTLPGVRVRLYQLFKNILENSLKYHRPGTPPRIAVRAGVSEGGWHEIRVEDNGIGFDAKHAEVIFGMFERLHGWAQYEGTGIGLASCRKIAQQHGGTVRAEGRPNVGATFFLRLPGTPPPPGANEDPVQPLRVPRPDR